MYVERTSVHKFMSLYEKSVKNWDYGSKTQQNSDV